MAKRSLEERVFIVEGADLSAEIWRKLRKAADDLGLPKEFFHRLSTPEGDSVIADMAKVMQEAWGLPTYDITVDYNQTIEQMVAAGSYNYANRDISSANFGQEVVAKKGVREELKAVLLHLDRVATSQEVLAEMERLGLRPATLAELLALGAKHPELQREFPIIALGSSCTLHGYRQVAFLWSDVSRRGLYLSSFGGRWTGHCRFLAVSK